MWRKINQEALAALVDGANRKVIDGGGGGEEETEKKEKEEEYGYPEKMINRGNK